MKIIKEISEDEMIAVFLKMEIDSKRFGDRYTAQLEKDKRSREIVDFPDLSGKKDNEYRKFLLKVARGYGSNKFLFVNFPSDVRWFKAKVTREDLKKVKYIKYSYWVKVSDETRKAEAAAETIRRGEEIFGQKNGIYWETAEAIKSGAKLPEMIFVSENKNSQLVLLEGHMRLTSYFLVPEYIPKELGCIVGFSDNISEWIFY